MARLTISLIGAFQVNLDDHLVTRFESNKVRALLAYLAVESSRSHSRQALAGLLWPDYPEPSALANLRHALANLREVLANDLANPAFLTITREQVQFNPASPAQVDLASFEGQIRAASTPKSTASPQQSSSPALYAAENIHQLKSAIALYRAPFLEGFSCDSQPFEEWALARRERTECQMREALAGLARLLGENGEVEPSIQYARRLLELEPWDEAAHRLVMEGLARTGQRSAALAQFETCRRVLRQELNLEPAVETILLHETIRSGKFSAAVRSVSVLEEMAPRLRPNLPRPLTSFVGRDENLAEVRRLLGFPGVEGPTQRATTRLLTLSGPGGCGKTRLAIAAARSLNEAGCYHDGVCWVDLTALSDPALVPQAVAEGLGLTNESGDRGVWNYLLNKQLLLVLDNIEHLIEACARLAEDLLNECSNLIILTTSREPLHIPGEVVWRVPSLSAPELQAVKQLSVEELLGYGAARLFAERAEAASPGWRLAACVEEVAAICRRLDGIPLAIELAAARVRMMSAGQIAARLENAFSLLSGGSRTAMPRHQTLQSCIDWSYNLLSPVEQILLQHLSIFSGDWTLEAAEAVAAGVAGTTEFLGLLSQLVDRSLVIVEQSEDQVVRYHLLETIRQYAQCKLAEVGEEADVRDRHLAYVLQLALEAEPHLRAKGQIEWENRLDEEMDNLRQALEWALGCHVEDGLRLASALRWFWYVRPHASEGIIWLERLLAAEEQERAGQPLGIGLQSTGYLLIWCRAVGVLNQIAYICPGSLKMDQKVKLMEQNLTLCRALGEAGRRELVQALAYNEFIGKGPVYARKYYEEGLELARQTGEKFLEEEFLLWLGMLVLYESDTYSARRYLEESLAIARQIEDLDGIGFRLTVFAEIEKMEGQTAQSTLLFQEGLDLARKNGNIWWFHRLAANFLRHQYNSATLYQAETALAYYRERRDRMGLAVTLPVCMEAEWSAGHFTNAARLGQEAVAIFDDNLGADNNMYLELWPGRLEVSRGAFGLARPHFHKMAMIMREKDGARTYDLVQALDGIAVWLGWEGQLERSACQLGAEEKLYRRFEPFFFPRQRREHAAAVARARQGMGEKAFHLAWLAGQELTLWQALEEIKRDEGWEDES